MMSRVEVDEVVFTRRKTIAVVVKPGGRVIVRAPLRTSKARILMFLQSKADWIEAARKKMAALPASEETLRLDKGASIPYLGRQYALTFAEHVRGGLAFDPRTGFALQTDRRGEATALLKRFFQKETRRLVNEWAAHYRAAGLVPTSIRVTSARTRWGSCSGKNGLSFSYRLAMLPMEVIGYVVAHELAHIRQHNHSQAFWSEVEKLKPEYPRERAWLKAHGGTLPIL